MLPKAAPNPTPTPAPTPIQTPICSEVTPTAAPMATPKMRPIAMDLERLLCCGLFIFIPSFATVMVTKSLSYANRCLTFNN